MFCLVRQRQRGLNSEAVLVVADIQHAVVFLRHSPHLHQAEAVALRVGLGGDQLLVLVQPHCAAVGVFAVDGQKAPGELDAAQDLPALRRLDLGGGLQCVVQQVDQQGARSASSMLSSRGTWT